MRETVPGLDMFSDDTVYMKEESLIESKLRDAR